MIKALAMEFSKTRRRKVWLIVAAMIGIEILWALWSFRKTEDQNLKTGWLYCLYQFPMLNSIIMPFIAAVVASRLSDIEHKGQTLKLLNTVIPAGRLFDAKFLCGAVYMLITAVLQVLLIVYIGHYNGFQKPVPIDKLIYYLFFTLTVNLTILLLQQVLSLLFANQMIPLSVGLIGGLAGLFTMFFPENIEKLVLWGYYGVLSFVRLDWDKTTRISNYYYTPIDWSEYGLILLFFLLIYVVGRTLFIRKEV